MLSYILDIDGLSYTEDALGVSALHYCVMNDVPLAIYNKIIDRFGFDIVYKTYCGMNIFEYILHLEKFSLFIEFFNIIYPGKDVALFAISNGYISLIDYLIKDKRIRFDAMYVGFALKKMMCEIVLRFILSGFPISYEEFNELSQITDLTDKISLHLLEKIKTIDKVELMKFSLQNRDRLCLFKYCLSLGLHMKDGKPDIDILKELIRSKNHLYLDFCLRDGYRAILEDILNSDNLSFPFNTIFTHESSSEIISVVLENCSFNATYQRTLGCLLDFRHIYDVGYYTKPCDIGLVISEIYNMSNFLKLYELAITFIKYRDIVTLEIFISEIRRNNFFAVVFLAICNKFAENDFIIAGKYIEESEVYGPILGIIFNKILPTKAYLNNIYESNLIHICSAVGTIDTLELVLRHNPGFDIDSFDSNMRRPVDYALEYNRFDILNFLGENCASLKPNNVEHPTLFHTIASSLSLKNVLTNSTDRKLYEQIMKFCFMLIIQKQSISQGNINGLSPLVVAVKNGNYDLADIYISVHPTNEYIGHSKLVLDILMEEYIKEYPYNIPDFVCNISHLEIHNNSTLTGLIKRLISNSFVSEQFNFGQVHLFHYLVSNNFLYFVYYYLSNLPIGFSVDMRDENGLTALHIAAREGLLSMTTLLLRYGADLNACDKENMTPLMHSLKTPNNPCSLFLIFSHADISIIDKRKRLASHYAIDNLCTQAIPILIGEQLPLSIDYDIKTSSIHLISTIRNADLLRGIDREELQFFTDSNGRNFFFTAAKLDNIDVFQSMHFSNYSISDYRRRTIFHECARHGSIKVLSFLITNGNNNSYNLLKLKDIYGNTCLHTAVIYNQIKIVKYLYSKFPDLARIANCDYASPYILAATHGRLDIIQFFEDQGFTYTENQHILILKTLIQSKNFSVADHFISKGFNMHSTFHGRSLLLSLVFYKNSECVEYLSKKGYFDEKHEQDRLSIAIAFHYKLHKTLDIIGRFYPKDTFQNIYDDFLSPFIENDKDPVFIRKEVERELNKEHIESVFNAIKTDRVDLLEECLDKGVYIEIQNEVGSTPLYESVFFRSEKCAQLLLDRGANPNHSLLKKNILALSIEKKHFNMFELLVLNGLKLEGPCFGMPFLHYFASQNEYRLLEFSILHGADIHDRCNESLSVFKRAIDSGSKESIEILKKCYADIVNKPTGHHLRSYDASKIPSGSIDNGRSKHQSRRNDHISDALGTSKLQGTKATRKSLNHYCNGNNHNGGNGHNFNYVRAFGMKNVDDQNLINESMLSSGNDEK